MEENYNLIISLISLGFFGGFSHCIGMCGPFVLTQLGNRLQQTPIDRFSDFKRLQNFALLPYHLGRITTYSAIGFFSSLITNNLQDFLGFRILSVIFLSLAIMFFLNLLLPTLSSSRSVRTYTNPGNGNHAKDLSRNKSSWIPAYARMTRGGVFLTTIKNRILNIVTKRKKILTPITKPLFKSPTGLNGYILGLILGFIPCGLLYGAFLIAAAMPSPFLAATGMFLFGISTFPALFLTAAGSYAFFKFEIAKLQLLFKITAIINIIVISLMIYKIIRYA